MKFLNLLKGESLNIWNTSFVDQSMRCYRSSYVANDGLARSLFYGCGIIHWTNISLEELFNAARDGERWRQIIAMAAAQSPSGYGII